MKRRAWVLALLCVAPGLALAAGGSTFVPYVMPSVWPGYKADSSFKSLYPGSAGAPKQAAPAAPSVPKPEPAATSSAPFKGGSYESGGGAGYQGSGSGGSYTGFQSDGSAPIVDPATIPREVTFEPRGKSASPAPSPSSTAAE